MCACAKKTGSELVSLRVWFGKGLAYCFIFPVDSATMIWLELGLSSSYLHVTVLLLEGYNSTLVAEGKVSRHDMTHLISKLIRRFRIISFCVSDLFR